MLNVPNILTLIRVVMIPLFVWSFLTDGISDWMPFAIVVIACITDALDGFIARRKKIVTDFGKLMDPLADKVLVMSGFVCFVYEGIFHPAVAIIVLAREFLVTGIRMIAVSKGKIIPANILGKIKTISQDITVALVVLKSATGSDMASPIGIIVYIVTWIMVILTLSSGIYYCVKNKEIFEKM